MSPLPILFSLCFAARRAAGAVALGAVALLLSAGSAAAQEMPELPARADSLSAAITLRERAIEISPADELDITVFQVKELSGLRKVNSRGEIRMPLIGKIAVAGLTPAEAEEQIAERLAMSYLHDPEVNIDVANYASQEVTIIGAAERPGVYPLEGPTSLMQLLAMAGNPSKLADRREIIIFRASKAGGVIGYVVDFAAVLKGEASDPLLMGNDKVVVPESGGKGLYSDLTANLRGLVQFVPAQ